MDTLGFDTSVTGKRFDSDEKTAAIVMNSSIEEGELGTPNETFGGPGKGGGGKAGKKYENAEDRGLVLIIS